MQCKNDSIVSFIDSTVSKIFFVWSYFDDVLCQLNFLENRSHFFTGTYQWSFQLNHKYLIFEYKLMSALTW